MRSFTSPAVLAAHGRLTKSRPTQAAIILIAAGELVGDKLPKTPSRTMPPAVVGRIGTGAICGHNVAGLIGAGLAGATAGAATFICHDARAAAGRRTGLPDLPFALIEDALAIGLAFTAVRLANGAPAESHPDQR
jgi:uncharacterized membrane protein